MGERRNDAALCLRQGNRWVKQKLYSGNYYNRIVYHIRLYYCMRDTKRIRNMKYAKKRDTIRNERPFCCALLKKSFNNNLSILDSPLPIASPLRRDRPTRVAIGWRGRPGQSPLSPSGEKKKKKHANQEKPLHVGRKTRVDGGFRSPDRFGLPGASKTVKQAVSVSTGVDYYCCSTGRLYEYKCI